MNSIKVSEQRKFFLIVGLACLAFGVWKTFKEQLTFSHVLLSLGMGFLLIEFCFHKIASWLFQGWMHFAHLLGTLNTVLLLTLIYFAILTPLAFLSRLFSKPSPYTSEACRKRKSSWFTLPEESNRYQYYRPY